jgi:hypothetical protein
VLLLNTIAPVFIGAMFYYIFCPDIWFVHILDNLFDGGWHIRLRTGNRLIRFFRYYLLDFVWAYSFMSAILILFEKSFNRRVLYVVVILFETALELLQIIPQIRGTFDVFDILTEVIANILVIYLFFRRRENEKI